MKKGYIIVIAFITIASCKMPKQNVWTKIYEDQTYQEVYTGVGSVMKDKGQQKEISLYIVKKLKVVLPYGVESVTTDSLSKLIKKIGFEYTQSHDVDKLNAVLHWNDYTRQSMREAMLRAGYLNKLGTKQKGEFCNCFIANLEKLYPDSIVTPLPDSSYTLAIAPCKYLLGKQ